MTSPAIDFWPWLKKQSQAQIIALLGRQPGGLRVESLELGADDYLVSPVQVAEVLARVRLALRRVRMSPVGAATRIETAHLNIDLAGRRVRAGGHDVHLTVTEFELLRCLASQRDQVLPHAHLLDAVWGAKNMSRPQSLRVFIRQLRKKIEPDPDRPRYIITEPGIGYRFQLSTPAAP